MKVLLYVQTGEFAAMMDVSLVNDGPVTISIDSREDRLHATRIE